MGKIIVENLTSPSHPTLKYNEIEKKNINLSSVKIEVEEEEQKEMDLSFYDGSPDWIRSTPTMITGADSDSIDYKISSDSSGYSYSDGDEWSPLKDFSCYFNFNQQQDAHEFLQCFLNQLETCCYYLETKDNVVKEAFGGRFMSKLRCCNCGHSSITREPLIDISLEIEGIDSVPAAFESFTKIEKIEFYCKRCKTYGPFEKQLLVDQAPTVAALHLKRFKNNGLVSQKVENHVSFPLELDILLYTNNINNVIIVHSGPSISSGHYYIFIRCAPNEWYKFNDEKVDYVQEDLVLAENAYILLYTKKGTLWFADYVEIHRPFVDLIMATTSNDFSYETSLKPALNEIEDNGSHVQVYGEDQFQNVETKKDNELMDALKCN
nr:ubiquitin carboxyl-terminal hydrolase 20-like [Solanum lycopersicum]